MINGSEPPQKRLFVILWMLQFRQKVYLVGRTHLDGYQMRGAAAAALTQLFCQIDIGRELIEIMINQYNVEHSSA